MGVESNYLESDGVKDILEYWDEEEIKRN